MVHAENPVHVVMNVSYRNINPNLLNFMGTSKSWPQATKERKQVKYFALVCDA